MRRGNRGRDREGHGCRRRGRLLYTGQAGSDPVSSWRGERPGEPVRQGACFPMREPAMMQIHCSMRDGSIAVRAILAVLLTSLVVVRDVAAQGLERVKAQYTKYEYRIPM